MDKNEIIRMAREAGMEQDGDNFFSPSHEEIDVHITDLERFAALVAKQAYLDGVNSGISAEREACAKVCSEMYLEGDMDTGSAADAILARGNHANG